MHNINFRIAYIIASLTVTITATLWLVMQPHHARAASTVPNDMQPNLLIHFDASSTPEMREQLIAQMGGEVVRWMHQINVAEIRMPVQGALAGTSLPRVTPLLENELVTYVEADQATVRGAYLPNDPDFGDEMMSYGLRQVQALEAWEIVTGSQEIVIAVLDSGINADHPEFAGRLVPGYDFTQFLDEIPFPGEIPIPDGMPVDELGHGTFVAGIIAATMDNGEGMAGVCPNCRIMPVKVLNSGNGGTQSQVALGILFAVDNGAQIINLSLEDARGRSQTLALAIAYAIERGVVVVAAAGNDATGVLTYPAAYDDVIGVGATDYQGEIWQNSNFGEFVDLVAPGDVVYSTSHDLNNVYHGYSYQTGTSMSAAFVSGVAGLLLSVEPQLTAEEITEALILGADDFGPEGWDPAYGYGRVNALGALMAPIYALSEAVEVIVDAPLEPGQENLVFLPSLSVR